MSMFLDTAKIKVKAGNGGDGMVAFRREKYVPNGGPWGGDGGRGGNVVFVVDEGLRTLMDFRYNRHFKADSGEKGMTKGMHGRGAEDLRVRVPQGSPTTTRAAKRRRRPPLTTFVTRLTATTRSSNSTALSLNAIF